MTMLEPSFQSLVPTLEWQSMLAAGIAAARMREAGDVSIESSATL
jgi:hypothetical protein